MSFLSDYTEKNSNLIPRIDIPCFAWNSQAEQGLLFFKAKSLDTNDFYDLIEWSKSGGYQGSVILFFDFESGKVFKPFAKKEMSFTAILSMQRVFTIFCRAIMTKRKSLCTAIFPENF